MTPEELLSRLDPEQRAIAEHLHGPLAVRAGAGSGKTRAITHRIAYGVLTGVTPPGRVLALTFTRKAAGEMQGRLRELGVSGVAARTFHGAALAQLGHFWPDTIGGTAPTVLAGKASVLAQVTDKLGLQLSGETIRDLATEIEWRKTSMLSLDAYEARLDERPIPTGLDREQVALVQREYSSLLEERRSIDFEDVLVLMTGMIESEPGVALEVRERYRFFTVDEYQDVSPLQHALLRAWLGPRDDLCVVGDASQTIYSFAGASSDFLLHFSSEFPHAKTLRLDRNYRSNPSIVAAANRLVEQQPGSIKLHAQRTANGNQPGVEWFASESDEAEAVALSVKHAIRSGTRAADIAVLYRVNARSQLLERALEQHGVPTRVHGAMRFFDRAEVKQAVMMIRGEANVRDERPLFQVVSDVLRSLGWTAEPPVGAAQRDKWEALQAIMHLVDEAAPGTDIVSFSAELVERQQAQHEPVFDAVTLSAIHAAKGLEWPLVHVVGMNEGILPISHAETPAAIDEERRLAYVAMTRAKDVLRCSGVLGGRGAAPPSRFLKEAGIT